MAISAPPQYTELPSFSCSPLFSPTPHHQWQLLTVLDQAAVPVRSVRLPVRFWHYTLVDTAEISKKLVQNVEQIGKRSQTGIVRRALANLSRFTALLCLPGFRANLIRTEVFPHEALIQFVFFKSINLSGLV